MKGKQTILPLLFLMGLGLVTGCAQQNKEDIQTFHLSDEDMKSLQQGESQPGVEEEGPQYQQPTMDVLRGKMQKFPAKYPLLRYPKSKVALVDVRPNRGPGYNNIVMLKTTDQIPNVTSFYKDRLKKDQWTLVDIVENQIYQSSKWEKGNLCCEVRCCEDFSRANAPHIVQLLYGLKPVPYHKGEKQRGLFNFHRNPEQQHSRSEKA